MRRMAWRNMTHLYQRDCAITGEKVFTLMPSTAPMPIYNRKYYASDAWDPLSYGRDYDFSRSFFEQWKDLFHAVPWNPFWTFNSVNSDYSVSAYVKNAYMCFDAGFAEDIAYGVTIHNSKNSIDTINCEWSEFCYFCINTNKSHKTFFSRNCTSCSEVWFSQDCIGCTNCVGCTGLRNKSYYIFNKPYSKEEYKEKLKELRLDSWSGVQASQKQAKEIWEKYPVKYQHSVQAKDCSGDYIYSSTELRNCFFAGNSQNCANCQSIIYGPIKDVIDVTSTGVNVELCYETIDAGDGMSNVLFSFDIGGSTNAEYSTNCHQCNNIFGCVGLRKKNYCIFNKQYSKEEYLELIPKIRKQMDEMPFTDSKGRVYTYGEFFPPEMSPYSYHETQGQEYFPLTSEKAAAAGFHWQEPERKQRGASKSAKSLPDSIQDVEDKILEEVIQCEHAESGNHSENCEWSCTSAFRIVPQELQFYRQMNLPLPRACFYCRHFERVSWRNKPALYQRTCMCEGKAAKSYKNIGEHFHGASACPNEFETSYAPDRKEIVYCEQCYNAEVI